MYKLKHLILCLVIVMSCTDTEYAIEQSLELYASSKPIEIGAVIACAANDKDTGDVLTFFYPQEGASNIRFYETESTQQDHEDFTNYKQVFIDSEPFFNGHLGKFTQSNSKEKWVIITFELNNEIKISNPIRIKHQTKPTVWTEAVTIDQTISGMPEFSWQHNAAGDNAIYFQVISDSQDNLLSGTYTYESMFQYYNISNVVLNVTTQLPVPDLISGNSYNFTLMDVSLDNWVNLVVSKSFNVQ